MLNINYFVTNDSITLYWDKPCGLPEDYCFGIYVDGLRIGESTKTHYTVKGLQAITSYKVQISLFGKDVEEYFVSEELTIVTVKVKKKLDVTAAPYFAVGDGKIMNTVALQQAINDCDGDSVVYIPAGTFITGALRLHSDMELYLEEGAVLQGTANPEDYLPRIPSRFEGYEMECYSSLLNLGEMDHDSDYNCRNVLIHGKGTIASGGLALATNVVNSEKIRIKRVLDSLSEEEIAEYETADTLPGRVRPKLVNMSNCRNIILSGLTFTDGACWNIHMIYSDNIVTHDCIVKSKGIWNGDGWDPDSSTNCTIFGTTFYTQDDSIAIKSGKNPEGNIINRPCEHIRIFDCISAFGHGIAIGSEMSGGVRDVKIWDCDLANTRYGVEIKGTKKRGGFVRDIHVENCTVSRVLFHAVGYNDDGIGAKHPPLFEACSFKNLHILGEYTEYDDSKIACEAIELIGFDEPGYEINNITFENLLLQRKVHLGHQNISMQYCKKITLQNVEVKEKTM